MPDRYPDNTPSSFQVDLPEPLKISSTDQWEVACTYLSYPSQSGQRVKKEAGTTHLHDVQYEVKTRMGIDYRVCARRGNTKYRSGWSMAPIAIDTYTLPQLIATLNAWLPVAGPILGIAEMKLYNLANMLRWSVDSDGHVVCERTDRYSNLFVDLRMQRDMVQFLHFPVDMYSREGRSVNIVVRSREPVINLNPSSDNAGDGSPPRKKRQIPTRIRRSHMQHCGS